MECAISYGCNAEIRTIVRGDHSWIAIPEPILFFPNSVRPQTLIYRVYGIFAILSFTPPPGEACKHYKLTTYNVKAQEISQIFVKRESLKHGV